MTYFAPKPECCVCGTKVYVKSERTWHLIDVSGLKGRGVSPLYPYRKGVVCGVCMKNLN